MTRLDSWKEIAAYLKRDVTTVRRWERLEGLPVHRHMHGKLGSVYAFTAEIDAWMLNRREAAQPPMTPSPPADPLPVMPPPRSSPRLWTLAAILLFIVLAALATLGRLAWLDRPASEFQFTMLPNDQIAVGIASVSPDGLQIAFSGARPGEADRLWIRRLDVVTPRALAGTEGAKFPFWSPDSRRIGFFAGGKLKTLDLDSGVVTPIVNSAGEGRGGSWNRDDVIVYSRGAGPLYRVSAGGGSPEAITKLATHHDNAHAWPEFLPDGERVLFVVEGREEARNGVYVASLSGGEPVRVLAVASNAIYTSADGGHLLYIRDGRLMAQRFDLQELHTVGDPAPVAEPVFQQYQLHRKGDFTASHTGVVAYRLGSQNSNPLIWRDRQGNELEPVGPPGVYGAPILAPQGPPRVAAVRFDLRTQQAALWVIDLRTGESTQFTQGKGMTVAPLWSPDAEQMLFASIPGPVVSDYRVKSTSGVGPEKIVLNVGGLVLPEQWTHDGRYLLYSAYARGTSFDTWALPLGKRSAKPFPVFTSPASEGQAQVSPSGEFLSYTSDKERPGHPEVYVTRWPSLQGEWKISTHGGGDARWRSDMSELFYLAPDGNLMSVPIRTSPMFEPGDPVRLFPTHLTDVWTDMRNHYDVSLDGQRFIMVNPLEDLRASTYTVVLNWHR